MSPSPGTEDRSSPRLQVSPEIVKSTTRKTEKKLNQRPADTGDDGVGDGARADALVLALLLLLLVLVLTFLLVLELVTVMAMMTTATVLKHWNSEPFGVVVCQGLIIGI